MDILIFSIIFGLICLALTLTASRLDKRISPAAAALCALYLALDDFTTGLPKLNAAFHFIPGHWNWSGKVLSLVLSIVVILALKLSADAVGLRLKQDYPRIALFSLLGFVVWGLCLGLLFKPGSYDMETIAFQATMPGIAEELAYRGIAPAILLSLFNRIPHIDGIPWAVIAATSLMFGVWHALSYSDGHIGFELMSGLFPFIGSIAGGWLRFKTRSLLVPVLGHGLANVAFHVAGGFIS